jgi:hypothetical protein
LVTPRVIDMSHGYELVPVGYQSTGAVRTRGARPVIGEMIAARFKAF